jgi:protein subunit release factor A
MIEAEITELEKRIAELSETMTKPEVARDITRLVKVNDDYQSAQSRLTDLMDEWERAETGASSKR